MDNANHHEERRLGARGLATRLRQARRACFGEDGIPILAQELGLPTRTWVNYEAGVTIPGEVILRFIELTDTDPAWLLHGRGRGRRARGRWARGR